MKILALDIATQTGIAVGSSSGDPKAWSVNLGEAPERGRLSPADKQALDNRRFSNVLKLTHGLIVTHNPDLIVIEAPIGGQNASAYLIGLVACVRGCAFNRGVKIPGVVYPSTVRKHFIGKAMTARDFPKMKPAKAKLAIKEVVADRCRLLGWQVDDLDCSDALALWDWACATYAPKYQAKTVGGLI